MALTPSNMLPLGTSAPGFTLPNVRGGEVSKDDFEGNPLLVMFICNHCPFVVHLENALAAFSRDYESTDLNIVGISSNDISTHPADAPEHMITKANDLDYRFSYLYDESQAVAQSYRAACTPDFFLFDAQHKLVYRGQFDDTRPNQGEPTGNDLRDAVDALLADQPIAVDQKPSMGCNIKWRAENAPAA